MEITQTFNALRESIFVYVHAEDCATLEISITFKQITILNAAWGKVCSSSDKMKSIGVWNITLAHKTSIFSQKPMKTYKHSEILAKNFFISIDATKYKPP